MLAASLCLVVVGTGCGEECVDAFDCRNDKGQPDPGRQWSCNADNTCEQVPVEQQPDPVRPDAGQPDAGQPDAGQPDAGQPDAGQPDAGQPDAGQPDAGPIGTGCDGGAPLADGGCPGPEPTARAYVRFVNVFHGVKNNASDRADAPWAPFRVDLHMGGDGGTKLFSAVEAGDEAVTDFVEVPLQAASVSNVEFVARNAEADQVMATGTVTTLEDGDRVTVFGLGSLLVAGTTQTRPDRPKLVVLDDGAFASVPASEGEAARVRYVTADRVTGSNRNRRIELAINAPLNTVPIYSADPVADGIFVPVSTRRVLVTGTPAFQPSQSGRLFFSVPEQTLTAGRGYYFVTAGDDRRTLGDEGSPALLIITAGRDTSVRLKRDPLVYFFNGLLPASGSTLGSLEVFSETEQRVIAAALNFATAPVIGELPATTASTLTVNPTGQPRVILQSQAGPLEPGQRYLAALCGRDGAAPQLSVVRDEFVPEAAPSGFVRFVHCTPSAPSAVDSGYYTLQGDGMSRGTFTSVSDGLAFGAVSSPGTGIAFATPTPPVVTPEVGSPYVWYGVRATSGGSPIERHVRGPPLAAPNFLVLVGEWSDSLTFRLLNVRTNAWGAGTPLDPTFSALP
jgi:hypothetical protein